MSDEATEGQNDNVVSLSGLRKLLGVRFHPHTLDPSVGALEIVTDSGSTMYLIAREDLAKLAGIFQSLSTRTPEPSAAASTLDTSDTFHFGEDDTLPESAGHNPDR